MTFIPVIICLLLAISSFPLIYLPITEKEQKLWQKLNIRLLRHWVTKKGTERWAQKSSVQNVIGTARKNIAWHGIMTFVFCTLIAQAQFAQNILVQFGSYLFLLPSIAYFFGSVVQRQKLVIIINRKCRLTSRSSWQRQCSFFLSLIVFCTRCGLAPAVIKNKQFYVKV